MPRNYQNTIALILPILLLSATAAAPTAYELLESYDFPIGILPKGVTNYDLDASSGKFNAYLNGSCSFSLEGSYELKYQSRISGHVVKDKLTNLSGVGVKVFFVWLNIVEVRRNGGNLEFSVGIASAEFPVENFYVCPQCGCELNCKSVQENWGRGSLRNNPYVYSI